MLFKSLIQTFIVVFALFISGVHPVFATSQFKTEIVTTYNLRLDGNTSVDQRIVLTNKTTNFFAREYKLTINSSNIKNISGRDRYGNIVSDIKRTGEQTQVYLVFNRPVVGRGKQLKFRLGYTSEDIARRQGNIWKITIPDPPHSDNLIEYKAIFILPQKLANNAYFKPKPLRTLAYNKFLWTGSQLAKFGAIGYLGNKQIFKLKLHYELANFRLQTTQKKIALPPDTAYQKVYLQKIYPKPVDIVTDTDGNWLAVYQLRPKESTNVVAELIVETFITPRREFQPALSASEEVMYLKQQQFWEVNNKQIKNLSKQLSTSKEIYRFTVGKLSYNYKKLVNGEKRKGALATLKTKTNAVCTEFTDLFITLARAAGIPAREANGYAFTENEVLKPLSLVADVLHAWPEFYDRTLSIWRPVDPTWENTTGGVDYFSLFDFDHIVFAYHGLSSYFPPPAGYYRGNKTFQEKQVEVDFANKPPVSTNLPVEIQIDLPEEVLSKTEIKGVVKIKNPNNVAKYYIQPKIEAQFLKLTNKIRPVKILPPLGTAKFKVEFRLPFTPSISSIQKIIFLVFRPQVVEEQIRVTYNNVQQVKRVKIVSWQTFYFRKILLLGGILLVLLSAMYLFLKSLREQLK